MGQKNYFDLIVLGGGHAGVEAAYLAQQFKLNVCLVTLPEVPIASTPCNPAIGGVGKGQVVREIDALGGIMGRAADLAGIQFRTLNESKGAAVQSTRVQVDKLRYSQIVHHILQTETTVNFCFQGVISVEKRNDAFFLQLANGSSLSSQALVVTSGTFLNGKLHMGLSQHPGGRMGCSPSLGMKQLFIGMQFSTVRFKTGTPPRLLKNSVDLAPMEPQHSDPLAKSFHFAHLPDARFLPQLTCYLTRTNQKTLEIIRQNRERSPLFNGQIEGVGPRYCPSIEDKAFRYPDKDLHHVFIEPEGGDQVETFYPNGLPTSLPKEIQEAFIKTIPGLENAIIKYYGYAVEYDAVDTTSLGRGLESKNIPGLFFAGQVNGTSGYEEAAGQGVVAGINAAFKVLGRKVPFILDRRDSYIGVMIDDLVSNRQDGPYRLFTARSENRLYLREDNTYLRMAPYRQQLELDYPLDRFLQAFAWEWDLLNNLLTVGQKDTLKMSGIDPYHKLAQILALEGLDFSPRVVATIAITARYQGYIQRADMEYERFRRLYKIKIDWQELCASSNISFECKLRIREIRPESFEQLQKISGIRPATLAYVAGRIY